MAKRIVLALALVVAAAVPAGVSLASTPAPQPPARYEIRVELNLETPSLTAVETVDYANSTGEPLNALVFNVPASHFGGFSLTSATVDGATVRPVMDKQSLEVPLPRPLPPGGRVTVTLQFRLVIPPGDGRHGAGGGVVTLGDWYPILAVYHGGWQRVTYSDIGDPYFSETADYDVYVTTSSPALVAASGYAVSHDARTWHFRARQARDFALAASRGYSFMTREVSGTIVTVAYLPQHTPGASRVLETAADSLKWYGEKVGPYPFANLTIAETVAERPAHTAQEHSGLIFLRSDMLEYNGTLLRMLTAHEVAHQWFFGVVGSDQVREPWLDEGLVNGMALDYFRQVSTENYKELWDGWGNFVAPGFLNRSIYDFPNGTIYFDEVYRRGATFVRDLEDMVGAGAFYRVLNEYYAANRFGVATADEFLARMRAASATDPLPLYKRTFDYPFLTAPNPSISVTLPSRIVAGATITLPVASDPPAARLRATLDGAAVPTSFGSPLQVVLNPGPGDHSLMVEALGPGVGFTRQTFAFTAVRAPAAATTPSPTSASRPTPVPQAPQPLPAADLVRDREAAWLLISVLGVAGLIGIASAVVRLAHSSG